MNIVYSLVWSAAIVLLLIAQAYHHRRAASALQRQQSKWFIFSGCVEVLISVGTLAPLLIFPSLGQNGSFYQLVNALILILLSFIFPLCIAIGIRPLSINGTGNNEKVFERATQICSRSRTD